MKAGQASCISGSRKPSTYGLDRLATYRAFCAAMLLTCSIAEAV